MAVFTSPVGRAQRGEAVLLAHVLGDLEAAQRLDLPLRRAVPERIRAPDHVVRAQALDQRAHERGGEARVRHRAVGERRADLAVDVAHPVLGRDLGQVGGPLHAAGLLELGQRVLRRLLERPKRAVVDDEVELGPVLGRLAHVPDRVVLPDARPGLLVVGGQQALVDADGADAGLGDLLVERVHQLLVVEPPVRLLLGREERITHRVALPAVRLERWRWRGPPRPASPPSSA